VGVSRSRRTGSVAPRVSAIGRRVIVERRKTVLEIDFGRVFKLGRDP
jgi:hypothetical protein